jgi:hydrogenase maturation factor
MKAGKLPAELLGSLLARIEPADPRVLIGPGIGHDAAVIDMGGPNLLVAKADPITFATDRIGWYAVHVNANDIACLGAHPAWFLATIFLPERASRGRARSVFRQVSDACRRLDIQLVGGHTEITAGITQPIVAGAMLGEVAREKLVKAGGAQLGDVLILTKGVAIEGSSVLAHEAGQRLRTLGVGTRALAAARRLLDEPGISVVPDSRVACAAVNVHAMHDPTEGGLATALYEMSASANLGIVIESERIDVLPVTQRLCDAAGLNPLGLLASGALLIAVAEAESTLALEALAKDGIPARVIGRFVRKRGVIMMSNKQRRPVPRFERDEVARFLSTQG